MERWMFGQLGMSNASPLLRVRLLLCKASTFSPSSQAMGRLRDRRGDLCMQNTDHHTSSIYKCWEEALLMGGGAHACLGRRVLAK